MSEQDQRVGIGGKAYQAGRDLVVQQGISPSQMADIMVSLAQTLTKYQADAMKVVEQRLSEFQSKVIDQFADTNRADPSAFCDPDFQCLLNEAQSEYVRSGDSVLGDTLIDIIARRSLEKGRNRLTLTLNDAVNTACRLTHNEFASLSIVYVLKYTQNTSVISFETLCRYLREGVMPFFDDLSSEQMSFSYLEARSCASISLAEIKFPQLLSSIYGGALGHGVDRADIEAHLPDGRKDALDPFIIPCLHDAAKFQPNGLNSSVFTEATRNTELPRDTIKNVWNVFANSIPSGDNLIQMLLPHVPNIDKLRDIWDSTPLRQLQLNSLGITIGHANAIRLVKFDGPLEAWIK